MTEKQIKFVDEYIKSLNAAESARRAGYAEKNADVTGAKLIRNRKAISGNKKCPDGRIAGSVRISNVGNAWGD